MLRENLGEFRLYSVLVFCLSWLICQPYAFAGEVVPAKMGLKALYEAAWDRQPESKSYQYRVDAAIKCWHYGTPTAVMYVRSRS